MIRNKIISAILSGVLCLSFAACSNNASPQIQPTLSENAETKASEKVKNELPKELYPAYIMQGTEKKWGFINRQGEFIIKPEYERTEDFFENGLARVTRDGKVGLIDRAGKLVVEPKYSYISDYSGKIVIASEDWTKDVILNEKGEEVFSIEGSIRDFSEGLAPFRQKTGTDQFNWGYLNEEGKVVIEPNYKEAQGFKNGKALVQISEDHYGIIDTKGKLVNEIQNDRIISLSEDTLIYLKKGTEGYRSGYMAIDGKSLMEATFSEAKDFEDGLAIVNASENYEIKFGVINKKGEFVIPAKYPLITSLGSGLFAVLEIQEYTFNTTYLRKALFDKTGKQLTDFKFYDLEKMKNGLIYATDDKTTFLIDQNGREVVDFPKVKGIGSIKPSGDLYKVEVDNYLYYYDQKGKVLWQSDNTIQLENGIVIKTNTFRPDRCIFIEYPEISGLPQGEVQEKINKTLKKKFTGDHQASKKDGDAYTETIETQFSADVKKDLLIVRLSGYYYPIGAAHGQPYKEDIHLNIGSGSFYSLKDLFKKGSRYKETVGAIIKQKINRFNKEEGGHIFSEDIGNWDESTGFTVKKDALHIYFSPYAIAPYAAGFPEFSIPYKDIMNIIDTEGEFWTSFERGAEEQPEKAENTISPDERAKIEEALKGYEVSMIEAINKNDFAIVEPWLYTDSSLYDSQKKLVQSLNRQGIKEKLQGYKIEDIRSNEIGSAYRVYVTETVAIQYPGKDYVTKTFNWVYSVKDAYEKNRYQLTYIDKWDKK